MRSSITIAVLLILVFACSVLIKRISAEKRPDSCLRVRAKILKQTHKIQNVQIPQCTLYGNYYKQQCNSTDSTCWCVTPKGKMIPNTMVQAGEPKQCPLSWWGRFMQRLQN